MAIFTHRPDLRDEPGMLESNVVTKGLLFYTCVMSELEKAARMPPSTDLRVLWSQLWRMDEYAKRFTTIRYRRLLGLPTISSS